MNTFWKDELAKILLTEQELSYDKLVQLGRQFTSLRVKTIDASGRVPVIRISDTKPWLKPKEWANEHLANLNQQNAELHSRLVFLGNDLAESSGKGAPSRSSDSSDSSDPAEVAKLRSELNLAKRNYLKAMELLTELQTSGHIDLDWKIQLSDWNRNSPRYIVE